MTKNIAKSAVIAALYAAITLILSPISYGVMQIRVSEALCVLAMYTPAAIPGLTLGCFIANILGPSGIADALLGSLATLIGVALMYGFRKRKFIAPMFNVLSNAVIVGLEIYYFSGVDFSAFYCMGWIALGELVSSWLIAIPLIHYFNKHAGDIGL